MTALLLSTKARVLDKSAPPDTSLGKSLQEAMGTGQMVIPGYLLHQTHPPGHGTRPGVLTDHCWRLFSVAYSTCHLIHSVCSQKLSFCLDTRVEGWSIRETDLRLFKIMLLHVTSYKAWLIPHAVLVASFPNITM